MARINACFLGDIRIACNGRALCFPFAKAEALLIYLIVNRQATRSSIAALLWGNKPEESAMRNLRNTLYAIKKTASADLFCKSSNKQLLILDPGIDVVSDVDIFLNQTDAPYTGPFLKGLCVKDADEFENWVMRTREKLENLCTERTYEAIDTENGNQNHTKVQKFARDLIQIDEYDEEAYRILMKSLSDQGRYAASLEVYNRLSAKLYMELSVTPDEATRSLYAAIQKDASRRSVSDASGTFFYGRRKEMDLLHSHYLALSNGDCLKSCVVIQGEMGIGKTFLKNRFKQTIDRYEAQVVESSCYEIEKENAELWRNLIGTIWTDVMQNPDLMQRFHHARLDADLHTLRNVSAKWDGRLTCEWIRSFLNTYASYKNVILIVEDIQWMDDQSMNLLKGLLLGLSESHILFVLTYRNHSNENADRFISAMHRYHKITDIHLNCFSYEEVRGFLKKGLPQRPLSKKTVDKIYCETEGNAFFLGEYLNLAQAGQNLNSSAMTYKMKDVLKQCFDELSPSAVKIAQIVSVFDDFAPMYLLEQLSKMDELSLLDVIDELRKKHVLLEVNDESISFKFNHRKLREYVYGELPGSRKKALHNLIGRTIENHTLSDAANIGTCYKLIYHYGKAGNHLDVLRIKIKLLNISFDYFHELFPVLYYDRDFYKNLSVNDGKTAENLKEVESLLQKVTNEMNDRDKFQMVYIEYLRMKGRYLIKKGEYNAGLSYINEMLAKSQKAKLQAYYLEGIKQKIYYCIQTHNVVCIQRLVDEALAILPKTEDKSTLAVFLRFKALSCKMNGEYNRAENIYNRSIQILSRNSKDAYKYALSIAAAYGYIGNIRRHLNGYADALPFYKKAIRICEENKVYSSLAYFEVEAGECAYHIQNIRLAKQYFLSALTIYRHHPYVWGRPIAGCFLCLVCLQENRPGEGLQYYIQARQDSKYLKNPKEQEVLKQTEAELRAQMLQNHTIQRLFSPLLEPDASLGPDSPRRHVRPLDTPQKSMQSAEWTPLPFRPEIQQCM
ncbi:AAA family ATPase [Ethanoligenens sp.]|uniref:AAA family ATPase n=1 Tax=Ethanoligenens sp. TaxID=2099655 RepID=UPI0039ED9376